MELEIRPPLILEPLVIDGRLHEFGPESRRGRTRTRNTRLRQQGISGGAAGKRILSISYDQSLLLTRELLLSDAGFEVTSVKTLHDALECCRKSQFDLIVMGHSIPKKDKQELIQQVRKACSAPVLSIRRHGEEPLPEADYSVDSFEGPTALLAAVAQALDVK